MHELQKHASSQYHASLLLFRRTPYLFCIDNHFGSWDSLGFVTRHDRHPDAITGARIEIGGDCLGLSITGCYRCVSGGFPRRLDFFPLQFIRAVSGDRRELNRYFCL